MRYKYFRVEMRRIQAFLLLQGSQVIRDLRFLGKLTFSQEMDIVLNTQVWSKFLFLIFIGQ